MMIKLPPEMYTTPENAAAIAIELAKPLTDEECEALDVFLETGVWPDIEGPTT